MFIHEILVALADGKKVARAGWPEGDYAVSGSSLGEVALTDDESKTLGVKKGSVATVAEDAIVYTGQGGVVIGYTLTTEDKQSSDWSILPEKKAKADKAE